MRRQWTMALHVGWLVAVWLLASDVWAASLSSFANFESGHVRPLAMSSDGRLLFAVNTPDNRLAVYNLDVPTGPTFIAEVAVGLEPVAVAARTNTEVWVVNHLSDSISIVVRSATSLQDWHVSRTLLLCDEPRDLVFAGPQDKLAFVTTARRGQNCPVAAQLSAPSVPRALVQVFDSTSLGAPLGGTPIANLELMADTPRGLAASPDGATVYAAAFHSGNRTTIVPESTVTFGGGLPSPPSSSGFSTCTRNSFAAPDQYPCSGLIVKYDGSSWRDSLSRDWSSAADIDLPDHDLFRIDAMASPPAVTQTFSGVGTILFNLAVRPSGPGAGQVFVSNTEALNHVRFEPFLEGHFSLSRVTVIDGSTLTPVHLNPHIDYGKASGGASVSLAQPMGLAFSPQGDNLFVAGFGSAKVGVFDASAMAAGSVARHFIDVGNGPSGLVFDRGRSRLYVMNQLDESISVVPNATSSLAAVSKTVKLPFDPSPPQVRDGRRFLYDARNSSAHGDVACGTCHVFGDFDSLAWELGNPFGAVLPNPNTFEFGGPTPFHPMKGPMATQSLRGLADAGPMHWRGDKTGAFVGASDLDTVAAFKQFNPAFVSLLGRSSELTAAEMQRFNEFVHTLRYPPNPIRALDNSMTGDEPDGFDLFDHIPTTAGMKCTRCHDIPPANPIGTDGLSSFDAEVQEFKVPHLRNLYQKVGMFRGAALGPQVRGFGFIHDGSTASLGEFLANSVFSLTPEQEKHLAAFLFAFDTGMAPAVGQQVTVSATNASAAEVVSRVQLLEARAAAKDCDLVAKGSTAGVPRGWSFDGASYRSDRAGETLGATALLALASATGGEITYTCVPPGSGQRIGIDRDEDGFLDRDEIDAAKSPTDPTSHP